MEDKSERNATIQIVSRGEFNPSLTMGIRFSDIDQFIKLTDRAIDESGFRKVDCIVFDNGQFSDEELEELGAELFIIE
jgi:hypothetical protein